MFVKNIPSLDSRTCRILVEGRTDVDSPDTASPSDGKLENEYYRITVDPERGGICSIFDKKAGREMVDKGCEWEAGQLIRERLPDRIVLSKFTCYGMERTSVSGVKLTEGACGPLYKSIMIEGECPGLTEHGMRCEVKLYNGQPRRESA